MKPRDKRDYSRKCTFWHIPILALFLLKIGLEEHNNIYIPSLDSVIPIWDSLVFKYAYIQSNPSPIYRVYICVYVCVTIPYMHEQ